MEPQVMAHPQAYSIRLGPPALTAPNTSTPLNGTIEDTSTTSTTSNISTTSTTSTASTTSANGTNSTNSTTITSTASTNPHAPDIQQADPWLGTCTWEDWRQWSPCSCSGPGGAIQQRQRRVAWHAVHSGDACRLLANETKACNLPCRHSPVHCSWGPWGSWSACSSRCGSGTQARSRHVYQREAFDGDPCIGAESETVDCSVNPCAQGFIEPWGMAMLAGVAMFAVFLCLGLRILWLRRRRPAPKIAPCVQDEEGAAEQASGGGGSTWLEGIPDYWTNKHHGQAKDFHELVYVSAAQYSKFDELLRATYWPRCTQDRQCPRATCPRTGRGCPCVQPGGDPGLPTGYRVCRVIRVESARMWRLYARKREEICCRRQGQELLSFHPPLRSAAVVDSHPDVFEPLDTLVNETYAFHGTSVRSALCIAQEDYRIDLAGSGAGSMYGLGTYLAESCTKADEYARDGGEGHYKGVFAMLLSRVCMGRFYYTTMRDGRARELFIEGAFDSTFGDREESADTFRELVVYDTDQVYPEYILLYHRTHRRDDTVCMATTLSQPLHMEVPVYWRNCHKDVHVEEFVDQYHVRAATLRLLQRLVSASLMGSPRYIVSARRVEHSQIWRRYMSFKEGLRRRSEQGTPAAAADASSAADGGRALTSRLLRCAPFAEQAVSIDHMDHTICEQLLWHGTSRRAAEAIAVSDFSLPRAGEAEHGMRFGRGVYFAEALDKSLAYAAEGGGSSFVLLCRVACGDAYHTTAREDAGAHLKALEAGKDSVLADPEGSGLREFVALREDQIYPEYILELALEPPRPMPPPLGCAEPTPPDVPDNCGRVGALDCPTADSSQSPSAEEYKY